MKGRGGVKRNMLTREVAWGVLYGHRPDADQPEYRVISTIIHHLRNRLSPHSSLSATALMIALTYRSFREGRTMATHSYTFTDLNDPSSPAAPSRLPSMLKDKSSGSTSSATQARRKTISASSTIMANSPPSLAYRPALHPKASMPKGKSSARSAGPDFCTATLQRRNRLTQCLKVVLLHCCGNRRGWGRFHDAHSRQKSLNRAGDNSLR